MAGHRPTNARDPSTWLGRLGRLGFDRRRDVVGHAL
jgi:hypothetical protein